MPVAYLVVAAVGALSVLVAYRPVRRDPWTAVSFAAGWLCGELALQNIAWQVVASVLFGVFGAFGRWPGWIGLGLAVLGWAGLVGLAVAGRRSRRVVADALVQMSGPPPPFVPVPPPPAWGRWWRLTRAVPVRARGTVVTKNVDYWGDGARRHRLDVIRPQKTVVGAPVMVYVHGGAWVIGDKREQGKPVLYELVARGWVCVAINYRLSPRATWPDHVVDCKRAVAWVKEHIAGFGGDPGFVALSGGSAGGHLAALVALTAGATEWQPGFESADTSVDACVPFYGVMDMTGAEDGSGAYGRGLLDLLERRVMKTTAAEHPEVFVAASPTARVHAGAPPFFVLHGTNDTLVPVVVARRFVAELRAVSRAPVAYAELPLAQHAFDVLASLRCQATTAGVVAFLDAVRAMRWAPTTRRRPE
ncbi:MAG: alpha/beta hydrolase fold domain-containing protein [Acidimicrobiales bacterium]